MTKISDILNQNGPSALVSVEGETSVSTAVGLMNFYSTGTVLVFEDGKLAGILTKRDVLARVLEPGRDATITPAREIMTQSPHCVQLKSDVLDAIRLMQDEAIAHLPVLDGGLPVGVISLHEAVAVLARITRTENRELRGLIHGQASAGATETFF